MDWHKARQQENAIKDMGRNGGYKQEVVLYGLKEWVLNKWDELKVKQLVEQQKSRQTTRILELGLGLGQEGVQTAFYVCGETGPFAESIGASRSTSIEYIALARIYTIIPIDSFLPLEVRGGFHSCPWRDVSIHLLPRCLS